MNATTKTVTYTVTTRDVDGSTKRTYKTAKAARIRFEEMAGYTIEECIAEQCHDRKVLPAWGDIKVVVGTSNFGTRVRIEMKVEENAEAAAEAAAAADRAMGEKARATLAADKAAEEAVYADHRAKNAAIAAAAAAEEQAILAASKYAAIRLWGERLGSYDYFITGEQRKAAQMNAPLDALFERGGEWTCVSDLALDHPFRKAYAVRLESLGLDVAPAAVVSAAAVAEAAEKAAQVVIDAVLVIVPAHPGNELRVHAGRFVMTNDRHHTHSLDIGCTDAKRLLAHWEGFNEAPVAFVKAVRHEAECQALDDAQAEHDAQAPLVAAVVATAQAKHRPATVRETRIVECYLHHREQGLTERDAADAATLKGMDMDYGRLEALLNARAA